MKIYNEDLALQSQKRREVLNITTQVKAAAEKSGLRNGIAVVSSLHSNTAIIVNDDEAGLLQDLADWLEELSPSPQSRTRQPQFGIPERVNLQSLLLGRQAIVPVTDGRLDLGPQQAVLFVELDGLRPRRIVVKIVGD